MGHGAFDLRVGQCLMGPNGLVTTETRRAGISDRYTTSANMKTGRHEVCSWSVLIGEQDKRTVKKEGAKKRSLLLRYYRLLDDLKRARSMCSWLHRVSLGKCREFSCLDALSVGSEGLLERGSLVARLCMTAHFFAWYN